jgi:competence ComEA-like helix-hairpin-helix protein
MIQRNSVRRQEQPIEIGSYGYSIEGDEVALNAELQVPPQHAGGEWSLELWATDQSYREGALAGTKIAEVPVALPTPIVPYLHQVDVRTPARLPLQGRAYAMVMALVRRGPEGASVDAVANFAEPQLFVAPHLAGHVGYQIEGREVVLDAQIVNPRGDDNLSGTLSLELWAFPEEGAASEGVRLAAAALGCVSGQHFLPAVERRVAFGEPPVGRHRLAMILCEWTAADGYVARDRRDFETSYERRAPEPAAEARPPAPKAAPAAPAPATATATATGPVSIQTATVEELAKVKGLSLKLATEIVKARPFTSVDDLLRVRGIGDKTLERLKSLLTV